jgi:hypothetical protein
MDSEIEKLTTWFVPRFGSGSKLCHVFKYSDLHRLILPHILDYVLVTRNSWPGRVSPILSECYVLSVQFDLHIIINVGNIRPSEYKITVYILFLNSIALDYSKNRKKKTYFFKIILDTLKQYWWIERMCIKKVKQSNIRNADPPENKWLHQW